VLRETIMAAVEAHGAGKILPSEMKIENPKLPNLPKRNVGAARSQWQHRKPIAQFGGARKSSSGQNIDF
jgi:hypothetical protein